MITLFEDQRQALDRVLEKYYACPTGGRALVVAPTGWGKTIFFSSLVHALQGVGNVLIIAHRDELLNQARDKYLKFDPTAIVGKVGSGSYEWGAPVTVAGIDTISGARHLKNLQQFDYKVVIVDECHHAPAPKYQKVLNALKDAFQVGVTATARRLDDKSLTPIFGYPVFFQDILEAIQRGRLCNLNPAIAIKTEIELDAIRSKKNADGEVDFSEQELARAIDIQERNNLIVQKYQEYTPGKRAVAFCVNVEHATHMAECFNAAGIPAATITGETSLAERQRIFEAFHAGEIQVLTNVQVLTEGWDEPLAEVAIMARPTQSWALYIQCIGRVLRLSPGKEAATILDITDNSIRLKLAPQNLSKAIDLHIRPDETAIEALAREQEAREQVEREAAIAKLSEKRLKDLYINMFESVEWKEDKEQGLFSMELPKLGHRLAIVPSKKEPGLYFVAARLAPDFIKQRWCGDLTLEECQVLAEKRALTMINDPFKKNLFDTNANWRKQKIDPNGAQAKKLAHHHIEWQPGMTKGEASDLIDAHLAHVRWAKTQKAQRKVERELSV